MIEKINKTNEYTAEAVNNNTIDVLTQMSGNFDPDRAKQLIELEKNTDTINFSARPKLENVTHIISEENETPKDSNNIVGQENQDKSSRLETKPPRKLTLSDKYNIKERPRVDRIKTDLYLHPGKINEYEEKKSTSEPSIIKKAVRLITDKLEIKTKRGEELRDREAMRVALIEYRKEEDAKQRDFEEKQRKDILEREQREIEEARKERNSLETSMLKVRDDFDKRKQERFKRQRVQEIVEKDLNARLLTTDTLEAEILSENPEVQKTSIIFEGTQIPIYDLKGLSFSILSTTIDYHETGTAWVGFGTETYKKVLANPAIWGERLEDVEKSNGFGAWNSNARGNTISTSYWNSDKNINSHVRGNLIYGFERVEPDSIISVHNGDGATNNMTGSDETRLEEPDIISELEGENGTGVYNELLLRRYSECGIPKKPDYIITENGKITEASLRHAKYFKIPIVNIDHAIYEAKAEKMEEEIINFINESGNYLDIDKKVTELLSMPKYKSVFYLLERIGRENDIPRIFSSTTALEKQSLDIAKMELLKRIDFIKTTLEDAIDKIKIHKGDKEILSQVFSQFTSFDISILDVRNQIRSTKDDDVRESLYSRPESCNIINVVFSLKGSSHTLRTTIFDGERILKVDEAFNNEIKAKEYLENSDSSFYDAIEPLARKYFDEFRKSRDSVMN